MSEIPKIDPDAQAALDAGAPWYLAIEAAASTRMSRQAAEDVRRATEAVRVDDPQAFL